MTKKSGRPARSETDKQAMRAKIAAIARTLFREEGFDAISIRRLAKEVGCAPMTIYAHFENKTAILRYLWADVLNMLFTEIQRNLERVNTPGERLEITAQTFVKYWLHNPEHFRLVFMSNDVTRGDVDTFMQDPQTREYFKFITLMVQDVLPPNADPKSKTDTLISGLIGVALCHNTIRDYPWSPPEIMVTRLVVGSYT